MCSEKDPMTCHRTILICKQLRQLEIKIDHIIDENTIESHSQLEDRLLDLYGFDLEKNQLNFQKYYSLIYLNLLNLLTNQSLFLEKNF